MIRLRSGILRFLALILLTQALAACRGETLKATNTPPAVGNRTPQQNLKRLQRVPPDYRDEALQLLIKEANQVAAVLQLPEDLPIESSKLREFYISPPTLGSALGTFGTVSTSNYTYCVSVASKFSFLVKSSLQKGYLELKDQYLWPIDRVDTNLAFQVATQYLKALSVDVSALNRDCSVSVTFYTPNGKASGDFVPVYWVTWQSKKPDPAGRGANVEIFLPRKEIRQLHILNQEYLLREPLRVRSPGSSPTNLSQPP